ncbi:MAG: hypothetical protein QXY45_03165 [Candidatus Aenigmatarchaeota archaeon]
MSRSYKYPVFDQRGMEGRTYYSTKGTSFGGCLATLLAAALGVGLTATALHYWPQIQQAFEPLYRALIGP